jgi:hypothetical protein
MNDMDKTKYEKKNEMHQKVIEKTMTKMILCVCKMVWVILIFVLACMLVWIKFCIVEFEFNI